MTAPRADVTVVLPGGSYLVPGASRVSVWCDSDCILTGIDLYSAGKAPRLLFTGGANPFTLQTGHTEAGWV